MQYVTEADTRECNVKGIVRTGTIFCDTGGTVDRDCLCLCQVLGLWRDLYISRWRRYKSPDGTTYTREQLSLNETRFRQCSSKDLGTVQDCQVANGEESGEIEKLGKRGHEGESSCTGKPKTFGIAE